MTDLAASMKATKASVLTGSSSDTNDSNETLDTFVELHAASAFSFLRGASAPDALVARAAASACARWPLPTT